MPDDVMTVDVSELQRVQKEIEEKLEQMHGSEVLMMMRQATLLIQRDAKIFSPVDTGRLRASITPSVSSYGETTEGVVGSNVEYAPYQEFGTTTREGKPWVPAKRYLGRAFDANLARIQQMFDSVIKRIVER